MSQPKMNDGRIKVLRIITRLNVGGPARQIDSLAEYLDREKFDHVVVTGSVGEDEIEHSVAMRQDLRLRRVPELGRSVSPLSDLKALRDLLRIIREERPDIVHTHLAKAGLLGRIAAFLVRTPVRVHTFHGHLLFGYFVGWRLKSYIFIERVLEKITTYQICVGETVRDDLVQARIVKPDKSRAVYPGIRPPTQVEKRNARRQLKLADDSYVVLFVGRLVDIKRLDRFIDIMNDVSLLCPNVIGLVVGDGPERSAQEHKMRNPAMFRFVGWQHELGVYYGAADVVCLTSDNEGMPIALIEGALSGLPAVTTAVGSAAEVVIDQKTGFVVPASDTGLFASLVGLLAKDESLRAELGRAANVHANQTFGGERLARDHALTYERLIEEARR